jgi:hypothetical protein
VRVAFDLDDTLVPTTVSFGGGVDAVPFPWHFASREPLRHGGRELLRRIAQDHELWIYTTSLRHPLRVRLWLRGFGVRVAGVINSDLHRRRVHGTAYHAFSKASALFGIDLLVDDAPGVAEECRMQGVRCITVRPAESDWAARIARELEL